MAGADEAEHADLTVVTFNVHGRAAGWSARRRLLLDELAALDPDVVSLQELRTFPSHGRWIQRSLSMRAREGGPFHFLGARKRGTRGYESIGLLTRLAVLESRVLMLGVGGRVALRARLVSPGGRPFDFYATHFQHGGGAEAARLQASRVILEGIAQRDIPAVVAGDLNAGPTSETINALFGQLRSAHAGIHGQEPERTVPTDPARPGAVLDYILVTPDIKVLSAARAFEARDPGGRTASDHYGLVARLSLTAVQSVDQ